MSEIPRRVTLRRKGGAPQAELAVTRRDLERQQGLNAVYLKNVTLAFLLAVYGDADDEEHTPASRVHVLDTSTTRPRHVP